MLDIEGSSDRQFRRQRRIFFSVRVLRRPVRPAGLRRGRGLGLVLRPRRPLLQPRPGGLGGRGGAPFRILQEGEGE